MRLWRSAYDAMHDMMSCCICLLHARAVTNHRRMHTIAADLQQLRRNFGVLVCRFEPEHERPVQSAREIRLSPEHPSDRALFEVAATCRLWHGLTHEARQRARAAAAR